ncbi:E3 ubiquitin-protein ligase RSL1-like [Pyrus communis]|uniref:E3 ubiquitin-protein ligase RSL1-like n=1 Tax=Pyrus communis TaxID=23211 RepID=UPI0035C0E78D
MEKSSPVSHARQVTQVGESSNSKKVDGDQKDFVCEICVESKAASESFGIKSCRHSFCTDCMIKYVCSKLQENVTTIGCPNPDCALGTLEPEHCRSILPAKVFERWGTALCEAVIPASQKFYCPFKNCSLMLIIDNDENEVVRQSECPNCKRCFCAQCLAPWHVGIDCAEFQKLNKDEREAEAIMLRNLVNKKNWRRCPNCRFYVERTEGCNLMVCSGLIAGAEVISATDAVKFVWNAGVELKLVAFLCCPVCVVCVGGAGGETVYSSSRGKTSRSASIACNIGSFDSPPQLTLDMFYSLWCVCTASS